ncbi:MULTISPECIES: transposase [Sporomusa]|jgi:transposase|uniref:transposase n=1 Tax=Sporomusa TaxID=2375 RepID=UPI00202F5E7B|nr:transposase [Sporomusa sphaeroides]MCM0761406.1 transposase [Sporomusa sphaeroides DSM 2875]HML32219.1 transposase [Sporomusa sphaeroides]
MPRAKFNKEFKIQVVKQVLEEGKTASKVGKELELYPNMVARWVKEYNQYGESAFSGSGKPVQNKDYEILKLKKRIEKLEQEKQILKKFHAFLNVTNTQKE